MKILHIITRGDLGGAQVVVLNLVRNMPPGYQTMVAAGETGYLEDECRSIGVPFHLVPGLIRSINPLNDLFAFFQLISLFRREKPDLVHCHTSKAGIIARVAAALTGIPSVFTAHTWSFDNGMSSLMLKLSILAERFVAKISGPIITVSDANRNKALMRHIAPPNKIIRIWLGIPESDSQAQLSNKDLVVMIMTARFVDQKDHQNLVRAVAGLTGNWELWLVGDGPKLKETIELSKQLGVYDKIKFLGARSDVPSLLQASDVFILSTKWEGLPVSILEALRAGLPVVASDAGGISEMVTSGVNGYLSRIADVDDLREKLQALVHSEELRVQMGNAARARWEQDFRMAGCIKKHIDLYDTLVR